MSSLLTRTGPLAAAVVLALTLAACASGADDDAVVTADPTVAVTESMTAEPTPTETGTHSADAAGDPFALLKAAAGHVGADGSAKALAVGIVTGAGLDGDPESPATEVYAQLSNLLTEHVYLAGIAVDIGLGMGLDSPAFEAAAGALDENSVALADLVGSVAPDQRDAFLELWRNHIGFFVDYTKGEKEQALANLDQYRAQAGQFFETVTGGALPADAVAESLKGHIETLTAAIDAAQAGDTSVFSKLKTAAHHVGTDGSSRALAGGITQAAGIEGDLDSTATTVRVSLANLLQEHVYLAGIAVKTAYTAGLDSPAFEAAAGTLDENSVALADLVGSVAPDQRDAFLELWRNHIGFFVDYAKAAAADDEAGREQALANLDQYRAQAGQFFESVTGGALPADAVSESLKGHIETLSSAIDALAAALVS